VIYFDTAYLAKAYLNEPGSGVVRDYLKSTREAVASSSLARAELAAVFHRHLREGRLEADSYKLVVKQHQSDLRSNLWEWLPIEERFWAMIETCYSELGTSVFLRGTDAIHLVTAKSHGFPELFTNDRQPVAACDAFGLRGRNIIL